MSTAETKPRYTADDLLAMPDGDRYELVDGELVETPMSEESNTIGGWIITLLNGFAVPRRLGIVIPEQTYRCFPDDPNKIRKPDVSFILVEKRPHGPSRRGHTPAPPDIAVEVVSPGDRVYDLEAKLADYAAAGFPLVWVVNPERRTVAVYTGGLSPTVLGPDDTLTGGDVLPGFSVRVADLFPPYFPPVAED